MRALVHHLLSESAHLSPQKEAIVDGGRRFSYAEAYRLSCSLAAELRQLGAQRGDRIGIYLGPCVEQILSIFSASMADAVFVPMNKLLTAEQIKHIANDCRITGMIIDSSQVEKLHETLADIPSLRFVVVVNPTEDQCQESRPWTMADFEELTHRTSEKIAPQNIGHDLAAILYTSGSTGKPKGVMLSHDNILAGSAIVSTYLEIKPDERILAVLPFSFDAGANQLFTAFDNTATIVLIDYFHPAEVVEALHKEKITALAGVPTFWSLLIQPASGLAAQPPTHLRYITNTGGAMPQNVLRVLREVLIGTRIYLMYGLTEAFRSTYLPVSELDKRPTSIGKAIPNTEILVLNEAGEPCAPGEVGELVHRGPTVSLGYWGQPELTNKVLRPYPFAQTEIHSLERVCYSGDYVQTDAEGFIYFVGRRDTMLKSCGYRISPTEVEEMLFSSGEVRHAAVIGVPDEVKGQVIHAYLVPKSDRKIDLAAIERHCRNGFPYYMVPQSYTVLDELPRTSSGKVNYPELQRRR